jgi:rSAM/selenodomain-associated transferase 2
MIDSAHAEAASAPLSIIIPMLNEAGSIKQTLLALQPWRQLGCEVIVVDGGSSDQSLALAEPLADKLIIAAPGRARQMNAGADVAKAPWLLFLHADTFLPEAMQPLLQLLQQRSSQWGFFALRLSGRQWLFRVIERCINLRSRLTAVATGDQAMFVRAALFKQCGQFADIPLMEDVALSKRLRQHHAPLFWRDPVISSSRRWEQRGIVPTVLMMWRLRWEYFTGVSPQQLVKRYYD